MLVWLGNISFEKADYPGCEEGDFIVERGTMYDYTPPRIWQIVYVTSSLNTIGVQLCTSSTKRIDDNTLPTTSTVQQLAYKNDVFQINNGRFYRCLDVTNTSSDPIEYTYQWEEVIFIPKPTSNDAGKVLQVNSNGQPEWVTP